MSREYLVLDFETRSECDLKKCGAAEYARHPTTNLFCASWACAPKNELMKAPVESWSSVLGGRKEFLVEKLLDPKVLIVSHNASFERSITRFVLSRILKEPRLHDLEPDRFLCTASMACSLGLPRSLEGACSSLDLGEKKDSLGRKLILKYTKPRKATAGNSAKWHNDLNDLKRIIKYCENDVKAEVELLLSIPELSEFERRLWILDQKINERGFQVDRDLVLACLELIAKEKALIEARTIELSKGEIPSTTQRDKTLQWLKSKGVNLPNLQAKTVRDFLATGKGDEATREILSLRQSASKTSTAKYEAFEARSRSDGRSRDNLIFHSASTGRWAGSGVQMQNLTRSKTKDTDHLAEVLRTKDLDLIRLLYGDPMSAISDALRSCFIATPGKELFVVDYSSIEVRVLFWLAGHEAGLKAFLEGKDLYVEMAAKIFKKLEKDVTKEERALGKAVILGCIAEGTEVLTQTGFKKIESITIEDKIWDGKNFVSHQGLLAKGPKSVIKIKSLNIESTPDHWVLHKNVWRTAGEIALIEDTLPQNSDKKTENSLSLKQNFIEGPSAVSVSAACAELRKNYESINFSEVLTYCVTNAPNPSTVKEAEILLTKPQILFLAQNLERVGTLVSSISKKDVTELMTHTFLGMAVAELSAPSSPLEIFWNTLLHSMGLISGGSRWIELITTETMSEEILESFLNPKTIKTELKETFDLLNCGKENRFQAGGAIVHNCGYSMSANKFFETCKLFGLNVSEDLAKLAVKTYREIHSPVVELWKKFSDTSIAAVQNRKTYNCGKVKWGMDGDFLFMELPSRRRLSYYRPSIRNEATPWGEMRPALYPWAQNGLTRKWEQYKFYGALGVENACQAISRDLIADAMLKAESSGFEVLLSVHDELIVERKIGERQLKDFEKIMLNTPEWASGLPIAVEGFKSRRYRK